MKKSFVYFLLVAVASLCLGLTAQDKMAGSTGSTGKKSSGKKAGTGKKSGTGKKGGTGSTGKM